MSADKHRSQARRLAVLQSIAAYEGVCIVNDRGGIPLDAALVRLVGAKLVRLERRPSGSVFGPHVCRTLAKLTDAGREALAKGEA